MDWDCRGMHLHFMAISWGNDPQGYILNDDLFLRKLISNLDIDDWNNRIKKQIFSQWKTKDLIIDNNTQSYYYHPGLIKLLEKEQKPIKTTTRSRKKPLNNSNDKNNDLDYENAFILISHDIPFLNSVINIIYHMDNHELNRYVGDYNKFMEVYEMKQAQQKAAYDKQQKEIERKLRPGIERKSMI